MAEKLTIEQIELILKEELNPQETMWWVNLEYIKNVHLQLADTLRENEILRKALIAADGRVTPEMQREYQNSAAFKIQEYLDHANKIINETPYEKVNFGKEP